MKKIIAICSLLLVTVFAAKAQYTNYTISPASFTAEDEITVTCDLAGTGMAGETEAFLWTWSNGGAGAGFPGADGITNGSWGSSGDNAKLTSIGGGKFTFKLTGTLKYNQTPGQLKHFQFLLKSRTGSKQTADSKVNVFDPLIFVPSMIRVFPSKAGQNDVLTLFFHQDLASATNDMRMTPTTATIEVFDNTGTSAGTPVNLNVTKISNSLFSVAFIPTRSFTPGVGKKFTKFTVKFNGTVKDVNNANVNVSTASIETPLLDLK